MLLTLARTLHAAASWGLLLVTLAFCGWLWWHYRAPSAFWFLARRALPLLVGPLVRPVVAAQRSRALTGGPAPLGMSPGEYVASLQYVTHLTRQLAWTCLFVLIASDVLFYLGREGDSADPPLLGWTRRARAHSTPIGLAALGLTLLPHALIVGCELLA
jgi:hypothetical protein